MESRKVQQLLDKYLESQTSLEEEETLRSYFNSKSVDEKWEAFAPYFIHTHQLKTINSEGDIVLKKKRFYSKKIISVASVAAVFIIGFLTLQKQFFPSKTLSPKEQVYLEFKENILFVSDQLNRSQQGISYMKVMNESPKLIFKTK